MNFIKTAPHRAQLTHTGTKGPQKDTGRCGPCRIAVSHEHMENSEVCTDRSKTGTRHPGKMYPPVPPTISRQFYVNKDTLKAYFYQDGVYGLFTHSDNINIF